jgi:hypothetical protein
MATLHRTEWHERQTRTGRKPCLNQFVSRYD